MATCLDYVNIGELDALVKARQRATHQGKDRNEEQSPTSLTESNSDCSLGHEEHTLQGTITLPLHHKTSGDDSRPEQTTTGSPESHPFVAVHRWLEESGNSTAESDLLIDIPRAPFSDVSDTPRSQILEDHPALLSYATFALFEHARLASIDRADVTPILDRLNDETTWARWKSLREDVPQGVKLLDFLEDLGHVSWISTFHDRFSPGQKRRVSPLSRDVPTSPIDSRRSTLLPDHQLTGDESRRSSLPVPLSIPQVDPQEHPPPMTRPRRRGESPQSRNRVPRRKVSVASFGSASSHDGYDRFSPRLESPGPVNSKDLGKAILGFFVCECCPKKPKRFDTREELTAHESEKQFECSYCGNGFKSQAEAERHQNSLHLRKHSWSCSNLPGYDSAFQESSQRPEECDTCGYCGDDFPRSGTAGNGTYATEQDRDERIRHLLEVHKFRECNSTKRFYRADHFWQHLKHSHTATRGKWTDKLGELCCKKEKD